MTKSFTCKKCGKKNKLGLLTIKIGTNNCQEKDIIEKKYCPYSTLIKQACMYCGAHHDILELNKETIDLANAAQIGMVELLSVAITKRLNK